MLKLIWELLWDSSLYTAPFKYLWARLWEPSSWAALATLSLAVGAEWPSIAENAHHATAICGIIAFLLREKGNIPIPDEKEIEVETKEGEK